MIINPYELLGVSIQSSISEVKKAYYELALIMHPDKGGRQEDMIMLQRAYDFVIDELSSTKTSDTYETLQAAFEQFCKVQEETVPKFEDIYAEAFDLHKFNEYFSASSDYVWKSSWDQGYGEFMEESGMFEHAPDQTPLQYTFSNSIIQYSSPQEMHGGFPSSFDYSQSNDIDDFSSEKMYDYRQSFAPHETLTIDDTKTDRTLSILQKEREDNLPDPSSAYIWSYRGFLDQNGNRIKDYKSLM